MLALLPHEETWTEKMKRLIDDMINRWDEEVWADGHRKFFLMNGQGVYINTIDEPNVVIIPKHLIEC